LDQITAGATVSANPSDYDHVLYLRVAVHPTGSITGLCSACRLVTTAWRSLSSSVVDIQSKRAQAEGDVDIGAWFVASAWSSTSRLSATVPSTARSAEANAEDLKDIGVTVVGHRRRLLEAIAVLCETDEHASPAAIENRAPRSVLHYAPPPTYAERRQLTVMFVDLVV
jgi:hypothetical protein